MLDSLYLYFCVATSFFFFFFFFNDTATTEIYTLSLHDALPISRRAFAGPPAGKCAGTSRTRRRRSEEHTSELQSRLHLVCRLLLEKKKKQYIIKKQISHEQKPVSRRQHDEHAQKPTRHGARLAT